MDPLIAVATNAKLDTIINRAYQDDSGHVISMHAAMFEDPNGVLHSPLVCYQAAGWTRLSESRKLLHLNFPDKSELALPVSISRWENEKDNRKVMVVYWFQLGEHFLFGRWDLGMKIRWSLSGQAEMARADQSDDGDPRHPGRGPTADCSGFCRANRRVGESAGTPRRKRDAWRRQRGLQRPHDGKPIGVVVKSPAIDIMSVSILLVFSSQLRSQDIQIHEARQTKDSRPGRVLGQPFRHHAARQPRAIVERRLPLGVRRRLSPPGSTVQDSPRLAAGSSARGDLCGGLLVGVLAPL